MNDLLSEYIDGGDTFYIMDKISVIDSYGSPVTAWTQGAPFKADLQEDTTIQTRIGEKLGVTSVYTVTTRKNINLAPLTVFRRKSDGRTFRVTSERKKVPESAKIDMALFTAEDYTITGDVNGG